MMMRKSNRARTINASEEIAWIRSLDGWGCFLLGIQESPRLTFHSLKLQRWTPCQNQPPLSSILIFSELKG